MTDEEFFGTRQRVRLLNHKHTGKHRHKQMHKKGYFNRERRSRSRRRGRRREKQRARGRGTRESGATENSVGHNEIIGVCRVGNMAESLGRDHWNEMMTYPRKPIAHWHSVVEWSSEGNPGGSQGSCNSLKTPPSP